MKDELPDRLRVTAEEYEPDGDRMWTRVSAGMREPRTRAEPARAGWRVPQLALATGAAVVLIGAIVFFGHAMGIGPVVGPTPEPPAAGPGTRTAEATNPADPTGSGDATSAPTSEDAEEATGGEETADGPDATEGPDWLRTDGSVDPGSNDYWSQATLTLRNDEPLVALVVELRVAEGDGVESSGAWTTDIDRFGDAVITSEDGFLVYRWTLKDGVVLPAGEYTLAGQFGHEGGARTADDDGYSFEAEAESGDQGRTEGDFE